jgi:hypothetical protein
MTDIDRHIFVNSYTSRVWNTIEAHVRRRLLLLAALVLLCGCTPEIGPVRPPGLVLRKEIQKGLLSAARAHEVPRTGVASAVSTRTRSS